MMHIREGSESNLILSNETYLQFEVKKDGESYRFDEEVFFASLGKNHFDKSYQFGDDVMEIELDQFIPNPVETLVPGDEGIATLKLVIAGTAGRQEHILQQGTQKSFNGTVFNFTSQEQCNELY